MTKTESRSSLLQFCADLNPWWGKGIKKMIGSYIDTSEKLAKGALSFQEKATTWAKDTPWAPFFEAQHDMAGQFVAGSTEWTRKLWKIAEEEETETKAAG